MKLTKSEAIAHVYKRMPYSNQITELDIESEKDAIRFTWRCVRFRVAFDYKFHVQECEPGVLVGSNVSILLAHLLNGG